MLVCMDTFESNLAQRLLVIKPFYENYFGWLDVMVKGVSIHVKIHRYCSPPLNGLLERSGSQKVREIVRIVMQVSYGS